MTTAQEILLIASMDIDTDHEELFNRIYDEEHVPNLLRVPGVTRVSRYVREDLTMSLGGAVQRIATPSPKYHAIYEITGPDVLVSNQWAEAVETGRWPRDVRPFTKNRQHVLLRAIG